MIERFHHQPIPVPQCVVTGKMMMYCILFMIKIKEISKRKKTGLSFCAKYPTYQKNHLFLDWFGLACRDVSSKTSNIHQQIEKLKKHEMMYLFVQLF